MADNSAAFAALRAHTDRVRGLEHLVKDAAPAIAPELKRVIDGNVARGVGPDDTPWPTTEDGHIPLQRVGESLRVRAVGSSIVCRLEAGRHARHHLGRVKGGKRRPILPTTSLPDPFERAIRRVLEARFRSTMGLDR